MLWLRKQTLIRTLLPTTIAPRLRGDECLYCHGNQQEGTMSVHISVGRVRCRRRGTEYNAHLSFQLISLVMSTALIASISFFHSFTCTLWTELSLGRIKPSCLQKDHTDRCWCCGLFYGETIQIPPWLGAGNVHQTPFSLPPLELILMLYLCHDQISNLNLFFALLAFLLGVAGDILYAVYCTMHRMRETSVLWLSTIQAPTTNIVHV